MIYTNSAGKSFDFAQKGMIASLKERYDWTYEPVMLNGALASLRMEDAVMSLKVGIGNNIDMPSVMESLYSVLAQDLYSGSYGILSDGEWMARVILTGSSKDADYNRADMGPVGITIDMIRTGLWYREIPYVIKPADSSAGGFDYPFDYAFDYRSRGNERSIVGGTTLPGDFRMTVYGPATNPMVMISGNTYRVDTTVPSGAILTIDSREGTVEMRTATGVVTNEFEHTPDGGRGSGEYIFELIPTGEMSVDWDGTFGFDLTVYDERDERLWTE